MSNYQPGKVYIWCSRDPSMAWCYGQETTVTGPIQSYTTSMGTVVWGWPTDTQDPNVHTGHAVMAWEGDLRPKQPPSGELKVLEWFKEPEYA